MAHVLRLQPTMVLKAWLQVKFALWQEKQEASWWIGKQKLDKKQG